MKRLLKRRYVQQSLESAEKEMGGKTLTLEELDKLLTEQGIDTKGGDAAFRIAADDTTRLIYIRGKRVSRVFPWAIYFLLCDTLCNTRNNRVPFDRQEHVSEQLR